MIQTESDCLKFCNVYATMFACSLFRDVFGVAGIVDRCVGYAGCMAMEIPSIMEIKETPNISDEEMPERHPALSRAPVMFVCRAGCVLVSASIAARVLVLTLHLRPHAADSRQEAFL